MVLCSFTHLYTKNDSSRYNRSMDLLLVDLKKLSVERMEASFEEEGLMAGIRLHREYGDDSLVLAAPPSSSVSSSSINSWSMVWHSEVLGHETYATTNSDHGYSLFRLGIKAMVILGRSDRMKYLLLSQDRVEIIASENLRYSTSLSFEEVAFSSLSDLALSTGPAADRGVKYSVVQSRGKSIKGLDLGHSFYLHNLKGIVFPGFPDRPWGKGNVPLKDGEKGKFFKKVRTYGGYCFVSDACRLGWLPVRGWKDRFDPRAESLDGKSMMERYGTYPESCSDCLLACDRRKKDGHILPRWTEVMTMGTNLGFFDSEDIEKIVTLTNQEGLDTSVTGGIIGSIIFLGPEKYGQYGFDPSLEGVLAFIKRLSSGSILYNGLSDIEGAIECVDHMPIEYDLRGSSAMALSYSSGLGILLPSTMMFPQKRPDERAAATIAFYEAVYALALNAFGHPPFCSNISYYSKAPEIVFRSHLAARFYSRRYKAFGHSALELLEKGMEVMELLGVKWNPLPSYFILNCQSALSTDTVPLARLQSYWDEEKVRVEILLKSKRDKMEKPSSSKTPNVGPKEDLGRDGDPGLQ